MFIYREGDASDHYYNLNEVGLYGMPNLVGSATVITSYSPIVDSTYGQAYGPDNLTTHLDDRSHRWDMPPLIDAAGTIAPYNSCFRVDSNTITGSYVLGLDHGVEKI